MQSLEEAGRQLQFARNTSFREVCKPFVGKGVPMLTNESIALVFTVSKERAMRIDEIATKLPVECKDHFNKLRRMEADGEPFFERFVLFAKSVADGMLVGFGVDEGYYVMATLDQGGSDLWEPKSNLFDEPATV